MESYHIQSKYVINTLHCILQYTPFANCVVERVSCQGSSNKFVYDSMIVTAPKLYVQKNDDSNEMM